MIKHLTQPTKDSCMATCLSMVVGITEMEGYELWHDKLVRWNIWFDDVLDEYKIPYYYGSPRCSRISGNVLCFATVASLNMPGMLHQILIQHVGNEFVVYDPAKGREGAKYYISYKDEITNSSEVHLQSWSIDLIIPLTYKD